MIDLIVEIFVPLPGGDGSKGRVATGYPVTRKLILTARHPFVVESAEWDDERPVEIRWRHPNAPDRAWKKAGPIRWHSERWDLALFEYDLPTGISPWGALLSEQRPFPDMQWSSIGFPRVASKNEDLRNPFPMAGQVFPMMATAERFHVEAKAGPEDAEDWKGASGSPVIVDWRVLGVVVSVPDGVGAQRLQAVPLCRVLREEPEFCEKVGFQERKTRRDELVRQLIKILRGATEVSKALDRILVAKSGLVRDGDHAARLAERLIECELQELVCACNDARDQVDSGPERIVVSKVVQLILPALYDLGVVESVCNARGDCQAALLTLPAFHPTVAEIIMAGADGRGTDYCPRDGEGHFPKGRLHLPEEPEEGFDEDGRRAQRALEKHLEAKFRWDQAERFFQDIDAFMIRRFPGGAPPGASEQRRVDLAAGEISYQSRNKGRTFYLIVHPPDAKDVEGRMRTEATFERLRLKYAGLMFLALDETGALDDAQWRLFRPFVDLLPMKSKPQ